MIAHSEGTSDSPATQHDGYDVIVTGFDGKPEVFIDFSHHPFQNRPPKFIKMQADGTPLVSTASGRYQILYRKIWEPYQQMFHLPDFSPESQDRVAIQLIKECGAISNIEVGDVQSAVLKCASRWASFPSNNYHQGGKSMQQLVDFWNKEGHDGSPESH